MAGTGEAVYFNTVDESWKLGWTAGDGRVKDEKGKVWEKKEVKDTYVIMDESCIDSDTDDLLKLNELHEGALLRCVRRRHAEDKIYTFIGPSVILSLNPWKFTIPDYMDDKIPLYIRAEPGIPPHIWSIGRCSYENMLQTQQCQTILVSGESGAGKTEAVKSMLKFLGALSTQGVQEDGGQAALGLQAKIEASNPILETFGNAKTVRNDNSSRFGKFLKVSYDSEGHICGASTLNYLLERSRVVGCGKQERIFHSFYQVLAAPDAKSKYGLDSPSQYPNCGSDVKIDGVNDTEAYEETCEAMGVMGLTGEEKDTVWGIVAGILHLQRVVFEADPATDVTDVSEGTSQFLEKCATCWGVPVADLRRELIQVTVKAGNERVIRNHSIGKSTSVRDALCKEVYASLFQWLIFRINETMRPEESRECTWIGLLDIFGFEHFQTNSLEQLCINLANEMLQNHYNQHIFTADIEECRAEGIETQHVHFQDNASIVHMIASNSTGILAHLDDQCKTRPDDDDAFLERITQEFEKNPSFYRSKLDRDAFRLMHYAAEVRYSVKSFGEKNLDSVQDSLLQVVRDSSNPLIPLIVRSAESAKSADSVTGIFKKQLRELLDMINQTKPSWIRCIKPHPVKRAKLFDPVSTMAQLCSSGVLETVRVRKSGYPVRLPHSLFVNRFKVLLPPDLKRQLHSGTLESLPGAQAILDKLGLGIEKAQIGKTKVFLRTFAHTEIEDVRTNAYTAFANEIRSWGKTALAMQDLFNRKHQGLLELLRAQHRERRDLLDTCLEGSGAISSEEDDAFAAIVAQERGDHVASLVRWFESSVEEIRAEEDSAAAALEEMGAEILIAHQADERARGEIAEEGGRAAVEAMEEEGFERLCIEQAEAGQVIFSLCAEKQLIEGVMQEDERRSILIIERRARRMADLEEDEAFARLLLHSEAEAEAVVSLHTEHSAIRTNLCEASRQEVVGEAGAQRSLLELEEEQDRDYLALLFQEEEGLLVVAGCGRDFWEGLYSEHRFVVEEAEEVGRARVEEEEEEGFGVFAEAFAESYRAAHSVQSFRELHEFQAMEHINRLRIEDEYEATVPYLRHEQSRLQVRLLAQYMEDCANEETDRRADIVDHYNAFWDAIDLAWAQAFQRVQINEIEGELWEARRGIEGVWEESRAHLETMCLKDESRVAAIDRGRELEMVHAQLDALMNEAESVRGGGTARSLSPLPFRHGSYSPRADYVANHSAISPMPASPPPRAVQEHDPVPRYATKSRAATRSTSATHDPFKDGTWLWRAAVPSVSKRWSRVFVRLVDGELKFYASETGTAKVLKLRNVLGIESHNLPDRDGYKAPDEHSPTIAKRFSERCQHSAMKLQLKGEVEGAAGKVGKAMLLCAEFPSVAVMWLRRLRQEWGTVCDTDVHPHGHAGNCVPGKGSLDLAPLLAACPDNSQAVELVRDLRKWLRKAKRAGIQMSPTVDLRQYCSVGDRAESAAPSSPPRAPTQCQGHSHHSPHLLTPHSRSASPPHFTGLNTRTPIPYGLGKHSSTYQVDTHCTATQPRCAFSRRSVSRACEGGGGNVYSAPRILGLARDKGRIVGQIALGGAEEGDDHPDNDSDLSEEMPIEQRVSMIIAERDLVERPLEAARQEGLHLMDEWREAWRQTFNFNRRVRRRQLISLLQAGRDNAVRKEVGKAHVYTTPATVSGIDVFMKRVFHECGDDYIEEDEFVTWCSTGGEDLLPCRVIQAEYTARVAAPVAGVAIVAYLASLVVPPAILMAPSPVPPTPIAQVPIPAPSPTTVPAPVQQVRQPTPAPVAVQAAPPPDVTPPSPVRAPQAPPPQPPAPAPPPAAPAPAPAQQVVQQVAAQPPPVEAPAPVAVQQPEAPPVAPAPQAPTPAPIVVQVPEGDLWECQDCYYEVGGNEEECTQCGSPR